MKLLQKALGVLSAFALACMLVPASATPAHAASLPTTVSLAGVNLVSGSDTTYWAASKSDPSAWCANSIVAGSSANWNAKYDGQTGTLTLKNTVLQAEGFGGSGYGWAALLYANGDLKLVLEGENTLSKQYMSDNSLSPYHGYNCYERAVYVTGSLDISGTGSLDAIADTNVSRSSPAIVCGGDLNIQGATVYAEGRTGTNYPTGYYGLCCANLNVATGAVLEVEGTWSNGVGPGAIGLAAGGVCNVNGNAIYSYDGKAASFEEVKDETWVKIAPELTVTLRAGDVGITGFEYIVDSYYSEDEVRDSDWTACVSGTAVVVQKGAVLDVRAAMASGRTFKGWSTGATALRLPRMVVMQSQTLTASTDLSAEVSSTPTNNTAPSDTTPTLATAAKKVTSTNTDKKDPAGSAYNPLQLKAVPGNKKITIKWKKVVGAGSYQIYGAKCGVKKMKRLASVGASNTKWTQKKLKKGTYYKYIVIATKNVGGTQKAMHVSKSAHAVTRGGKKGNPTKISLKTSKLSVKVGKRAAIKAAMKSDKKVNLHIAKFRYESMNAKVAKVNAKGKVTGVAKGKTKIFVFAQNGLAKTVTVTVK